MSTERTSRPPDQGNGYSWPHAPDCVFVKSHGIEWCDCRGMWSEKPEQEEEGVLTPGGIVSPDPLLPDEIILEAFDDDLRFVVFKDGKDNDWRVWGESKNGGALYAVCLSDQLARLVAHALNVLLHARGVGPLRESDRA